MKLQSIQIFRALAANAVLIFHLSTIEMKYGHGVSLLPAVSTYGAFGVDIFFVISGIIMVVSQKGQTVQGFLAARVTRIYPPYWFYSLIVLLVSLIVPTMVNSSLAHPPSIWKSALLVPDSVEPLLAVGWTLVHEMYFYLVFAALIAARQLNAASLGLWAAVILVTRFVLGFDPSRETDPILAVMLNPLTFEFIAGALVGLLVQSHSSRFGYVAAMVGVSVMLGFGHLALQPPNSTASILSSLNWARTLVIGLPFAGIIYGFLMFEIASPQLRCPRWLVLSGDASYSVYLTHILVLSALGRLFSALPTHTTFTALIFLVFAFLAGNISGLAGYKLIERPSLRFFRNLAGRAIL